MRRSVAYRDLHLNLFSVFCFSFLDNEKNQKKKKHVAYAVRTADRQSKDAFRGNPAAAFTWAQKKFSATFLYYPGTHNHKERRLVENSKRVVNIADSNGFAISELQKKKKYIYIVKCFQLTLRTWLNTTVTVFFVYF